MERESTKTKFTAKFASSLIERVKNSSDQVPTVVSILRRGGNLLLDLEDFQSKGGKITLIESDGLETELIILGSQSINRDSRFALEGETKFTIKLGASLMRDLKGLSERHATTNAEEIRRGVMMLVELERIQQQGNEVFIRERDNGNKIFYRTSAGIEKGLIFV